MKKRLDGHVHRRASVHPERMPLVFGSSAIEVCECGSWRLAFRDSCQWNTSNLAKKLAKAKSEPDRE